MADFKTKFESKRQDWETPDSIFLPLHKEFGFNLDVCAHETNKKVPNYYDEKMDALKQEWKGTCWMNPPFGEQGKWVKKAFEESKKGSTVVCLLPARTNTNWWHDYCLKGEIRYIKGRPKFSGAKHGLPQPLAIVIFDFQEPMVRICRCSDIKYPMVDDEALNSLPRKEENK